jgi:hypothetical protein
MTTAWFCDAVAMPVKTVVDFMDFNIEEILETFPLALLMPR